MPVVLPPVVLPPSVAHNFTPTEGSILRVLHLADGRWVPQDALIRAAWGDAEVDDAELYEATRHTLRVNISRIRRKLAPLGWQIANRPNWYRVMPVVSAERVA